MALLPWNGSPAPRSASQKAYPASARPYPTGARTSAGLPMASRGGILQARSTRRGVVGPAVASPTRTGPQPAAGRRLPSAAQPRDHTNDLDENELDGGVVSES